jgi:replicative DNA helicase
MPDPYNVEIERALFSCLMKSPDRWGDVSHLLNELDFSSIHRGVYEVFRLQLEQKPVGSVAPLILSDILKKYGVNFDGISILDYLNSIFYSPVNEKECENFAKEIKRLTIRRSLMQNCKKALKELEESADKKASELLEIVDKTLTGIQVNLNNEETEPVFGESFIEAIEERGNNPISVEDFGYMGPFQSINESIGSLVYDGSFVVTASRTGGGKSSLGFFYNTYLAGRYQLPVLHLDTAEMTKEQLQHRAVCSLSKGRVPLWAVKTGEWRKNKEWVDIIRGEIWPQVKNLTMEYKNVGGMTPKEIVSFCRRFYFNKVGRGNHMLIHWDYIKGTEAVGKETKEYQAVGYLVGAMKSLVTEEITGSIWTSVQANRTGIYSGKSKGEIRDSEDSFSLSDRIIQQATQGFLMRYKIPDEIYEEGGQFGNVILKSVKERDLLGKNAEEMLKMVEIKDGKDTRLVKNYFNLDSKLFHYEDKGSLREMAQKLGQVRLKHEDRKNKDEELLED